MIRWTVSFLVGLWRFMRGFFARAFRSDGPVPSLVAVADVEPAPVVGDAIAVREAQTTRPEPVLTTSTPWSFYEALVAMCERHGWNPESILMVMYSESGVHPWAGSSASGLIQFIPSVLGNLGWSGTPEEFRALSAEAQLPYVERYYAGRLPADNDPSITYLVNYEPVKISHASDPHYVLDRAGEEYYADNRAAFDPEGKGFIEVADLGKRLARVCTGATWEEHLARLRWAETEAGYGGASGGAIGAIATATFGVALAWIALRHGAEAAALVRRLAFGDG